MTLQQLTKLIDDKRQELADLEAASRVLAQFNGHGKLDKMDRAVAALDADQAAKRKKWRVESQKKRDAKKQQQYNRTYYQKQQKAKAAQLAAATPPPAPTSPPPPFDLNKLPIERLRATPWGSKASLLNRARSLLLLDLMQSAGVPTTKANVNYVYADVLRWGTRPLAQSERFKHAKLTKKGWSLLPAGAEKVAEAQRILAENAG